MFRHNYALLVQYIVISLVGVWRSSRHDCQFETVSGSRGSLFSLLSDKVTQISGYENKAKKNQLSYLNF